MLLLVNAKKILADNFYMSFKSQLKCSNSHSSSWINQKLSDHRGNILEEAHAILPSSYLAAAPSPTFSCNSQCSMSSPLPLPESFFSLCCRHVKGDGNTGVNPKTTAKKCGLFGVSSLFTTPVYIQQAYGRIFNEALLIFILLPRYFLHWADFCFIQGI